MDRAPYYTHILCNINGDYYCHLPTMPERKSSQRQQSRHNLHCILIKLFCSLCISRFFFPDTFPLIYTISTFMYDCLSLCISLPLSFSLDRSLFLPLASFLFLSPFYLFIPPFSLSPLFLSPYFSLSPSFFIFQSIFSLFSLSLHSLLSPLV